MKAKRANFRIRLQPLYNKPIGKVISWLQSHDKQNIKLLVEEALVNAYLHYAESGEKTNDWESDLSLYNRYVPKSERNSHLLAEDSANKEQTQQDKNIHNRVKEEVPIRSTYENNNSYEAESIQKDKLEEQERKEIYNQINNIFDNI